VGDRVEASGLVTGHVDEVRHRLDRCVAVLRRMVDEGWFVGHEDTVGMEVELDLVDPLGRPRLVNDEVLARLRREDMQHELGQFNVELNMAPRLLSGSVLRDSERQLADVLAGSAARIEGLGARLVAIGTLPTLGAEQLTVERLSSNPRYGVLSRRMRAARRRPFMVRIDGPEPVEFAADSVAPEAAATSLQLHLRVPPERFAAYYNAAQAIAAAQVAVAANAPYLLGRQAWQETRIALCEQVLDTRRRAEVRAGAPPRVRLGERWISDPVELFDDLVRSFPPLLPTLDVEDPDATFEERRVPALRELRLHNGTVWRWNRPVYDIQAGHPQLRIENRVLPSGPTALDMLANAAFYYGLVRAVADADPPPWLEMPFPVAERDLHRAARDGLAARLHWRGVDHPADELTLEVLLPAAAAGLDAWGVDPRDRDRYLGVIGQRVDRRRTGAAWQIQVVRHLEEHGLQRTAALREMTRRYVEHARSGAPVHEWPAP